MDVNDDTDVGETVDLVKTILKTVEKSEKRIVQISTTSAIGVHAQIVGELSQKDQGQ